ncbi:hypothetical protein J5Y39_000969 [Citrobacter sedlakii]|nr:hypothetical protein [Citrobacter sedlakii]
MITVPNESSEAWLSTLKDYQSSSVRFFLEQGEERALELWLSSSGPESVSPFGGDKSITPKEKSYIDMFKSEFKLFICGSDKYIEERERLSNIAGDVKTYLVSVISAAIAATLGTTVAFITPAVVIALMTVSKMGVNAWCSMD